MEQFRFGFGLALIWMVVRGAGRHQHQGTGHPDLSLGQPAQPAYRQATPRASHTRQPACSQEFTPQRLSRHGGVVVVVVVIVAWMWSARPPWRQSTAINAATSALLGELEIVSNTAFPRRALLASRTALSASKSALLGELGIVSKTAFPRRVWSARPPRILHPRRGSGQHLVPLSFARSFRGRQGFP